MLERWRACILLVLVAALAPRGHAQEPVPDLPSESAPSEAAPAAEGEALTGPLREAWWWNRVGPVGGGPMSDVAIHPDEQGLYAATTLEGTVWITLDEGRSWVSVLPGLGSALGETSTEERVLLEVESRIEELTGDLGLDEVDEALDPDDYADDPDALEAAQQDLEDRADQLQQESADLARSAVDEVQTELQSDPWFLEQASVLEGSRTAARPRVWFTSRGWLVVGRADGLWITKDLGGSWTHVLQGLPCSALLERADGTLLVGTSDGLRASRDLAIWDDPDDGTEGLRIYELVAAHGVIYAATERGLWTSDGLAGWDRVPGLDEPVLAILADPFWEGGLWLATPRTVLRSDDAGVTTREPLGAPLGWVVSMVLVEMDHLVAAGNDGTWESLDGGTTWSPVAQGLSNPETRGLAIRDDVLLLTSEEGVFRLGPEQPVVPDDLTRDMQAAMEGFVPVGLLLDATLLRAELQASPGRRWAAALAPDLQVEGRYQTRDRLLYEPETGSTRELDAIWQVAMRLQWTPPGRQSTALFVHSGGEGGVSVLDASAQAVATSSVSRGSTEYRSHLAGLVTEMHAARAELISAWPVVRQASILDQTLHALRIQELEAQLDALTEGAVSRWRHGHG